MMKKLLCLTMAVISLCYYSQTQNVNLDSNFGNGGIITTPYNSEGWDITKVKFVNNKIVFFGSKTDGSNQITIITRYNANGSIDTSFGTNGNIEIPKTEIVESWCYGIDNSGNIYIGGQVAGNTQDGIIRKFNQNGTIDTSFGTNGSAIIPNGNFGNNRFLFINGKIIFALKSSGQYIYCLNSNGTLDTSFGTNGKVYLSNYFMDEFIESTKDNKIIGMKYLGNSNGEIYRLLSNGQVDNSFTPYSLTLPFETTINRVKSDELGNIYFVSSDENTLNSQIKKIKQDGTLDTSFGNLGTVTDTNALYADIEIDSNNKILLAGMVENGNDINPIIKRYNNNGTLDLTFNTTGIKEEPSLNLDFFEDIDLLPDGNIIGSGETNGQLFLLKYLLTGQLSATETAISSVSLFPNPTTDFFEVKLTSNKKIDNVTVFDATGKVVRTVKSNTVNVQDLTVGTYVVNIKFEDGTTGSEKIIKK